MASTVKTGAQVDNDYGELSLRQALGNGSAVDEKSGTSDDRANMFRMGKKQELRVCDIECRRGCRVMSLLMLMACRGTFGSFRCLASQ